MQPRHYPPFAANLEFSWLAAIVLVLPLLLLGWQYGQQADGVLLLCLLMASGIAAALLLAVRTQCRALVVDHAGRLWLDFASGREPCRLLAGSMAWPWLVCLQVRDGQGRKHSVLVWRDAVPAEVHRALRVYIAWSRDEAAGQETEQKDY